MKLDLRVRKVLQLLSDGKDHAQREIIKHAEWKHASTFHFWLTNTEKLKALVEPSGTYGYYRITSAGQERLSQFNMMDVPTAKASEPVYDAKYNRKVGFLLQIQIPANWKGGQDKLDSEPLAEKLRKRGVDEWDEMVDEVIQLIHFWAFKEDVWGNRIASHEFLGKRRDMLLLQARPQSLKQLVETLQTFQK